MRRLLPFLYFWTAAWNLKIFLAKQILSRPYEKVITWLFSKSVSVFLKLSIYASLEGKSYFSQKDTGRIWIVCVFYLPQSQQVVICQFWKFHLLWLFNIKVTPCALGVKTTSVAHLKALIILYRNLYRPVAWQNSYYRPRPLEKGHFTP